MAGFPVRPSKEAFGPAMEDQGGVVNPRRFVDSHRMNLTRWQLTGLGQAGNLAWCMAKLNGALQPTVEAHGSVWQGAAPAVARASQGVLTFTWAAQYADEKDALVTLDLKAALVSIRKGGTRLQAEWFLTSGRILTVELRDNAGAVQDGADGLMVSVF